MFDECRWQLMCHRLDLQAAMRKRDYKRIAHHRYMIDMWTREMHRLGVWNISDRRTGQ